MKLFIEVASGPDKGKTFKVQEGARIGRSGAEIPLGDEKVSLLHAQVELYPTGDYVLVDLDSSNGIVVNYQKVKKVFLKEGVKFKIGDSIIRVTSRPFNNSNWNQEKAYQTSKSQNTSEDNTQNFKPASSNLTPKVGDQNTKKKQEHPQIRLSDPEPANPEFHESDKEIRLQENPNELAKQQNPKFWRRILEEFLTEEHMINQKKRTQAQAFKRPLLLKILTGHEIDREWVIAWGPRHIGNTSFEFNIVESRYGKWELELNPYLGEKADVIAQLKIKAPLGELYKNHNRITDSLIEIQVGDIISHQGLQIQVLEKK